MVIIGENWAIVKPGLKPHDPHTNSPHSSSLTSSKLGQCSIKIIKGTKANQKLKNIVNEM